MPNRIANQQVADLVGPIFKLLEQGSAQAAEVAIAGMTLWVLDCIEEQRLRPELADEAFTLLCVHLGDNEGLPPLSEEAQELILEGQHLHHWRDSVGADPDLMRGLAGQVLARLG
jgi:hypothetical protein